jgi:hypothetical protein
MSRREQVGLLDAPLNGANVSRTVGAKPLQRRMGGRFSALMLAATLVAAASDSRAAGRVFSDDFESGNLSKWSADGARSMCTVVQSALDGGTVHGGTHMMQCNWNGIVPWDDPNAYTSVVLPQSAWNYSSEFFIRLWLRYDRDVSHTDGGKVLRLYPDDHLDGFFMGARMNAGGVALLSWDHINGAQGPVFWGSGAPLGDQRWHKVEIYVNASTSANGILRIWIDGSLKQEATHIVSVSAGHQWGPLYLMSNWSNNPGWEHGASNHVYWDDIEVYTDAGSGASGNMSDATISAEPGTQPAAPQNLIVQ